MPFASPPAPPHHGTVRRGGGGVLRIRHGGAAAATSSTRHVDCAAHEHTQQHEQQAQAQAHAQTPPPPPATPPVTRIVVRYELGSDAALEAGVRRGDMVVARLRVYQRWGSGLCFARSRRLPRDVVINTPELRGHALHNDVVAVELLPLSAWQFDNDDKATQDAHDDDDDDDDDVRHRTQLLPTRPVIEDDDSNGSDDSDDSDASATATAPRSDTLPDGRRIARCVRAESTAEALARLPPELRLAAQMHAPSASSLAAQWPRGRVPLGRVVRVLWRELDALQPAHLADNVLPPGQLIREHVYYRFVNCNPLMPQLVVQGRDIPVAYRGQLASYMLLLRLLVAPGGDDDEASDPVTTRLLTASAMMSSDFAAIAAAAAATTTPGNNLRVYARDLLQCAIQGSLGTVDSLQANNTALATAYELPSETFDDEVEACVPAAMPIPSADALARSGRRDLRASEFVCTIDPLTARDLDDALSIRRVHHRHTRTRTHKDNDRRDAVDSGRVRYHVGVHIADVAHFVQPDTALDAEARRRATSTYLVDKAIPMLPHRLSENYCSLNPGEDKLAFSALFELDDAGAVVSEWFGPSIIRSRCRLTYEQAQSILRKKTTPPRGNGNGSNNNDDEGDVDELDDNDDDDDLLRALDFTREAAHSGMAAHELRRRVYASVRLLYEVAAKRRAASLQRGRVTIGNTRLGFRFADNNNNNNNNATTPQANVDVATATATPAGAPLPPPLLPVSFYVSRQIDANWLVEEFMLLANARVAEKIVQYLPDEALLRCHPPPDRHKMRTLKATLAQHGVTLAGTSAKAIMATIDAQRSSSHHNSSDSNGCSNDRQYARYVALCELIKFSLRSAEYVANGADWHSAREHFALGLPWYTHFTSPIRRYSDVVVHRQLRVALEIEQLMTTMQQQQQAHAAQPPSPPSSSLVGGAYDAMTKRLLHAAHGGGGAGRGGGGNGSRYRDAYNNNNNNEGDDEGDDDDAGAPQRVANVDVSTLHSRACYYSKSSVAHLCEHLNERKEAARRAGDASVELYFCLYLRSLAARARVDRRYAAVQCTRAVVLRLTSRSMQLFAPEIALSVQLSLKHASQRFRLLTPDTTGGDGATTTTTTTTTMTGNNDNSNRGDARQHSSNNVGHAKATTTIDMAAKAHRRSKGGKQGMPLPSSSSSSSSRHGHNHNNYTDPHNSNNSGDAKGRGSTRAPTTVTVSWGVHPLTHEAVYETFAVLHEVVVSLHVTQQLGRMTLHMIVLPPWERDIFCSTGATIPTSLTLL